MRDDPLAIGSPVPDFGWLTGYGSRIRLGDYSGRQHVMIHFIHEFGCQPCRTFVAELGQLQPQLRALGVEILIILGDSLEQARKYAEILRVPCPVLADPERVTYHRFGLKRGCFVIRNSATVIVDKAGLIRNLWRVAEAKHELPDKRELLEALQSLGGLP